MILEGYTIMVSLVSFLILIAILYCLIRKSDKQVDLTRIWRPQHIISTFWSPVTIPTVSIDIDRLNKRMKAYAHLQKKGGEEEVCDANVYLMMLGTIKKVEAKATSLVAIVVFVAISLITIYSKELGSFLGGICLGTSAFLILLSGIMVGGFHHVDQIAANKRLDEVGENEPDALAKLAALMRSDLAADLIRKEIEFEVYSKMLAISAMITTFVLLMAGLY